MRWTQFLTSKTVIGAIVAALGHLIGQPELAGYEDVLQAVSALLEAIGAVIFALGVRHATAKSAEGIVKLHPGTMVASLIGAVSLLGPIITPPTQSQAAVPISDQPVTLTHPLMNVSMEIVNTRPYTGSFVGESLRVIMQWRHPTDGGGNADSTVFHFRASKAGIFARGNFALAANVEARRKFNATVLADTFKLLKPALGDSVRFTVDTLFQCRQNACSAPGSGATTWGYFRSPAPPSMTFTRITVDSF